MTWFRCVDKSGGSAVLGHKSITQNGTYNASSDNLDGYDQVTVNVPSGGLPSWLEYQDIVFTEAQSEITIQANPNKTLIGVIQFLLDSPAIGNRVTGFMAKRRIVNDNFMWTVTSTNNQSPPVETSSTTNMSFSYDDTTHVITVSSSARSWRSGYTYRTVLIYEET